ncbi:MAG TPA: exodeoxyribonuclease VII large subunit [Solirubrobacteraceae bacterium]|nr:exodeoxyribonuclease VII large subunit [Solirubrobacteraceae bacterium]
MQERLEERPEERPAGIDGSPLSGPWPVGEYAQRLRGWLRQRARLQLFGEVWNLRETRVRVYFELRDAQGALPCAMWRDDLLALGLTPGALADGAQVVVGGGLDYYPGSTTSSPAFSFHVTALRVAGEGDLLAQLDRLQATGGRGSVRAPEGPAPPGAAAHDRRGHRRGRQGAR